MPASLLIATSNPAKAERFRHLFAPLSIQLYGPTDLPGAPEVPEEGSSHLAVACEKAAAWSRLTGDLTVASDGGVDIPVLGADWQSLTTRRATGHEATDEQRAKRLLRLLGRHAPEEWEAWWTEAVAVARWGEVLGAWEVKGLRGLLTDTYVSAPEAFRGFWVYGMWLFPQLGKRYWALTEEELRQAGEPWFQIQEPLLDLVKRLLSQA